jgi:histidine triad (HIT) family protein
MSDSVFTKIIKGEIPCHSIYEDDRTIVFLDIRPLNPGHVLVVPKKQVDHLWDLDQADYDYLMLITKKAALRIKEVLKPPRVGMNVEGFGVPHVHMHVYPLYKGLESTIKDYISKPGQKIPESELNQMAAKLAF